MDGRRLGAHLLRSVVAVTSAAVLVVTGWSWSVYDRVSSDMVTSNVLADRPAPPAGPDGLDEPVTALLVGIDSRTDASGNPLPPEILSQLRAGEDEPFVESDRAGEQVSKVVDNFAEVNDMASCATTHDV